MPPTPPTGETVRPGDEFRIASASKTFVATVVLQLAGEGRLWWTASSAAMCLSSCSR
ncbi:serine hydrolase [Streptomyces capitiformicae]|uniref:serine hydrolase n=1 Tax=Streptomyces capitiformicae TaxID=2014920 RepID=UPI001AD8134A|nr:serine hydrolase [Streptomyces capitiformicae]